jgi:hypothetical protein
MAELPLSRVVLGALLRVDGKVYRMVYRTQRYDEVTLTLEDTAGRSFKRVVRDPYELFEVVDE